MSRAILQKISGALASLPYTKGDSGSWSVIMQKLLISINLLLNDVFEGLEEGILLFEFRVCYVNDFVAIYVNGQIAEIGRVMDPKCYQMPKFTTHHCVTVYIFIILAFIISN